MFFSSKDQLEKITLIGEFVKVEGQNVILRIDNTLISVQHNGLENYKTKFIMVTGKFENNVLIEEKTQKVDDDFDYKAYLRLAKISQNYPEIF